MSDEIAELTGAWVRGYLQAGERLNKCSDVEVLDFTFSWREAVEARGEADPFKQRSTPATWHGELDIAVPDDRELGLMYLRWKMERGL